MEIKKKNVGAMLVGEWNTKTIVAVAIGAALFGVLMCYGGIPIFSNPSLTTAMIIPVIVGALFGPLAGGLVGFTADAVGCLFSGYGYNPIFCLPPILYGVFGGVFRRWLGKGVTLPKLFAALLPPVVFGSILWQSAALAFIYNSKGSFQLSLIYFLSTRSLQFAVTIVLDALVIYLLFRAKIFDRMGVWPPRAREK